MLEGSIRNFLAEALFPLTALVTAAFLTRRLGPDGYGLLVLAVTLVVLIEWSLNSIFSRATIKHVGEAKDWHGLSRFRLRGLRKVNVEALLIATGQNLKRLLRQRGWGRRPWPNGAPEALAARRLVPQPPTWSPSFV